MGHTVSFPVAARYANRVFRNSFFARACESAASIRSASATATSLPKSVNR
jgi:hypothetical protein